jgi:hypothetical protein
MLCVVLRVRKDINVFNLMSPIFIPVNVLHRYGHYRAGIYIISDSQSLRYSEAPRLFEAGRPWPS